MTEDPDELTRLYQKLELLAQSGGGLLLNHEEVKLLAGAIKSLDPPEDLKRFEFRQEQLLGCVSMLIEAWQTNVSGAPFASEHPELHPHMTKAEDAMAEAFGAIGQIDFKPGGETE